MEALGFDGKNLHHVCVCHVVRACLIGSVVWGRYQER